MSSMAAAGGPTRSTSGVASTGNTDAHLLRAASVRRAQGGATGTDPFAGVVEVASHTAGVAPEGNGAQTDEQADQVRDPEGISDPLLDERVQGEEQGAEEGARDGVQAPDGNDQQNGQTHEPGELVGGDDPLPSTEEGATEAGDAGGERESDHLRARDAHPQRGTRHLAVVDRGQPPSELAPL